MFEENQKNPEFQPYGISFHPYPAALEDIEFAIVGEKEQSTRTVAVRLHKQGMKGVFPLQDFVSKLKEIDRNKFIQLDL